MTRYKCELYIENAEELCYIADYFICTLFACIVVYIMYNFIIALFYTFCDNINKFKKVSQSCRCSMELLHSIG